MPRIIFQNKLQTLQFFQYRIWDIILGYQLQQQVQENVNCSDKMIMREGGKEGECGGSKLLYLPREFCKITTTNQYLGFIFMILIKLVFAMDNIFLHVKTL